jgi:hypothetical protein
MSWAEWIRAALILLLVLIALILVRYDAAGRRLIEADGTLTAQHARVDRPMSIPALMSK